MKDCKICQMYYNGECISDHCIQETKKTKCKNEKCGDYNPLCLSGCHEFNMRSVHKCEHFKSEYDIEEIDENFDETLGETE